MFGGVAGFGKRVLDEGVVRLGAFGRVELRLRQDFDVQIGEEAGKFFEFACIAAGEDDFVEHGISLTGFGLLRAQCLGAGFVADVEGEAADLAEDGGEGEQEGGEAVLFAVDGKKVAAEQDERHENQGEQGGQQQVGFAFVHRGSVGRSGTVII